jgi:hypothetical protein
MIVPEHRISKFIQPVLFVSLALLVLLTIAHAWVSWRTDFNMSGAAGAWTALAADLKNGVFYRPLYGPLGYGGTRYFPLHFVIQAGLMSAGLHEVAAGRLIELVSLVTLLVGIYLLLRRLGVQVWLSASSALVALATPSVQAVVGNIRGDVLPASLNLLGLVLCVKEAPSWRRIFAASTLFTLAFAAKPTTVFGLITAVVAFLLTRRSRDAWKLLAMTAGGYVLVLCAIQFASGGRAFHIFAACALSGGNWVSIFLKGPLNTVIAAASDSPRNGVAFMILGFAALLGWRADLGPIPPLLLASTTLVTAVIMGTPGADGNHLLDLYVASIIVFATWLSKQSERGMNFGICLIAVATLFTLPEQLVTLRHDVINGESNRQDSERVLQLVENLQKPVLADNPLLCIRAGQVPYVLDPFFFSVINARDSSFAEPLWQKMRAQAFGAVVLDTDPQSAFGQSWYGSIDFGPRFLDELYRSYYLANRIGDQVIFLPKEE